MAEPFGATPLFAEIRPIEDGYLLLTAKGVAEDFAQDLSSEEKNLMVTTQGAIQGATNHKRQTGPAGCAAGERRVSGQTYAKSLTQSSGS